MGIYFKKNTKFNWNITVYFGNAPVGLHILPILYVGGVKVLKFIMFFKLWVGRKDGVFHVTVNHALLTRLSQFESDPTHRSKTIPVALEDGMSKLPNCESRPFLKVACEFHNLVD